MAENTKFGINGGNTNFWENTFNKFSFNQIPKKLETLFFTFMTSSMVEMGNLIYQSRRLKKCYRMNHRMTHYCYR